MYGYSRIVDIRFSGETQIVNVKGKIKEKNIEARRNVLLCKIYGLRQGYGHEIIVVIPQVTIEQFQQLKVEVSEDYISANSNIIIPKQDRVFCRNFRVRRDYRSDTIRRCHDCSLHFEDSYVQIYCSSTAKLLISRGVDRTNQEYMERMSGNGSNGRDQNAQTRPTRISRNVGHSLVIPPPPPPTNPPPPNFQNNNAQPLRNRPRNRAHFQIPNNQVNPYPVNRIIRQRSPQIDRYYDESSLNFTRISDLQENTGNHRICGIIKEYYYGKASSMYGGKFFFQAILFDNTSNPSVTVHVFFSNLNFERLPQVKQAGQVIILSGAHIGTRNGERNIQNPMKHLVLPCLSAQYSGTDERGLTSSHCTIPVWNVVNPPGGGGRRLMVDEDEDHEIELSEEERVYTYRLQEASLKFFSHPKSLFNYFKRDPISRLPKYLISFQDLDKYWGNNLDNYRLRKTMNGNMNHNNGTPNYNYNFNSRFGVSRNHQQNLSNYRNNNNNNRNNYNNNNNTSNGSRKNYPDFVCKVIRKDPGEIRPVHLVVWDGSTPPNKPKRDLGDHDLPVRYPSHNNNNNNNNNNRYSVQFCPVDFTPNNRSHNQQGDPRAVMEVVVRENSPLLVQIDQLVEEGDWIWIRNAFYDRSDGLIVLKNTAKIIGLHPSDYRVVKRKRDFEENTYTRSCGYLYVRTEFDNSDLSMERLRRLPIDNMHTLHTVYRDWGSNRNNHPREDDICLTRGKIKLFSRSSVLDFVKLKCSSCKHFFTGTEARRVRNGDMIFCETCRQESVHEWTWQFQFLLHDPAYVSGEYRHVGEGEKNELLVFVGGKNGDGFFGRTAQDILTSQDALEKCKRKRDLLIESQQRILLRLRVQMLNNVKHFNLSKTSVFVETHREKL